MDLIWSVTSDPARAAASVNSDAPPGWEPKKSWRPLIGSPAVDVRRQVVRFTPEARDEIAE